MTNIIFCGMLDRHPDLKMVSVESGVGWIPFILEALDYEMSENAPAAGEDCQMLPSEYFKRQLVRHVLVRAEPQRARPDRLGRRGQRPVRDRLPAPDLPLPRAAGDGRREDVDPAPEVQRKILGENAAKLYRL